jgi:hypothetical protein
MPNLFSAFTSEVFRPLVTLLIPGAIAISTWFIGLLWQFPDVKKTASENHAETGLILVLAMTFAGMALEDLGTRLESWLDSRQAGTHSEDWYAYLRTAFSVDPIGRRYIRTLVLRLKFELGTAFAMLVAGMGILWLWSMGLSLKLALVNLALCAVFALWLFLEGRSTHGALAKNRANLLSDIRIVPPPASQQDVRSTPKP